MDEMLLGLPEVIRVSGLSRTKLYELMASGELESVKIGRRRLVPVAALAAYVDSARERSTGAWPHGC